MAHPAGAPQPKSAWHATDHQLVVGQLSSSNNGLSAEEATTRLNTYGFNELPKRPGRPTWKRFVDQCNNILVLILLCAAVVTGVMGHVVDTIVIVVVVFINTLIGFFQEGRAEQSLQAINNMLTNDCLVIRDGQRKIIPARLLVPGDVVFIQSGDRVPADLRLLSCKNLRIDESALTGESVSVSKLIEPVVMDASLGDQRCMAFSGTFVSLGQGTGIVVTTGDNTELGHIQHLLAAVPMLKSPLTEEIDRFARVVSTAVFILAAIAFIVGVTLRNYGAGEMFMIAVALAVAAIPEGLPAVLSITLAIGVQRMAKRHAIIRRLPVVDTLGAVDVICTDKTGTVTCNEMMVVDAVLSDGSAFQISGDGYAPFGSVIHHDNIVQPQLNEALVELARCGTLCSDARLEHSDNRWFPIGDPIEAALVSLAMKCGMDPVSEASHFPRADVIPFESDYRFMATLHRDHHGGAIIYLKGAPEVLLSRCSGHALSDKNIHALAQKGRRVLALACKRVAVWPGELTFELIEKDLELLGLIGAIDPPRSEAVAAIAECHQAGIRVAMITGDHAMTAQAIARDIGLNADLVLTGNDIDKLNDNDLFTAVNNCEVFARVNPEHKLHIIEQLQRGGRTIAMTGDGVNDAPALKRAHIGVAMGRKGTEVAKEAADMVLADDNFASIAAAVREGRTVFENIRKSIHFILPVNGAESLVLLAAIITGLSLPLTPVQILWVNLVSSVTLALSLAVEPGEKDLMRRPPRRQSHRLITGHFLWRIALVSTLICIGVFFIYAWQLSIGASTEIARSAAVNLLVFCEATYLLTSRSIRGPVLGPHRPPANPWTWYAIGLVFILQMLYTYTPFAQQWFGTANIGLDIWIVIGCYCVFLFSVIECEKLLLRTFRKGTA